jgi:hypothetical protein
MGWFARILRDSDLMALECFPVWALRFGLLRAHLLLGSDLTWALLRNALEHLDQTVVVLVSPRRAPLGPVLPEQHQWNMA